MFWSGQSNRISIEMRAPKLRAVFKLCVKDIARILDVKPFNRIPIELRFAVLGPGLLQHALGAVAHAKSKPEAVLDRLKGQCRADPYLAGCDTFNGIDTGLRLAFFISGPRRAFVRGHDRHPFKNLIYFYPDKIDMSINIRVKTDGIEIERVWMTTPAPVLVTAFLGTKRIGGGPIADVAVLAKANLDAAPAAPLLVFNDANGHVVDLNLRGSPDDITARYAVSPPDLSADSPPNDEPRGKGRPKLGVIAREITLLPRHWDWLARQPGGASVVLRRLVEDARRADDAKGRIRQAREAAYRFMAAMAGDLPGFEEATRALFAGDRVRFEKLIASWPQDIGDYATRLAFIAEGK